MVDLEKKIIEFKNKFALGGWLDENRNIFEVVAWFRSNFPTEEEIEPVEEPDIENVAKLPTEDTNAVAVVTAPVEAPEEVGKKEDAKEEVVEEKKDEIKDEIKEEVVEENVEAKKDEDLELTPKIKK